ncbi:FAD-dependent oxidoreductase [Rhodococcus sp. M8-50]|uniref:FAD-dependent oxidoreductase n=1 Tax=unclassified Rhodococcus (in: high G+C Gram-positive bacteria) TaxID=192944 RepID=UPI0009282BE7|nr:FAD-dependent oxidoreductase [Rhodococcus sp. M8]OLL21558.1 ferredoxin [Rhodococcus sp. M8]
MPHVITQNCCNDASCVAVCPVDCIHPTPDEPDYGTAEMLYIDNESCIDCGACIPACPVDAIVPDYDDVLPAGFDLFERLNAGYYADRNEPPTPVAAPPSTDTDDYTTETLRVAVVGSGPAAWYTAEELLAHPSCKVEVDMFERLLTPGGLVRFGVAPDHQRTKLIQRRFERTSRRDGFRLFLNVDIGQDLTHETLVDHYHAVVYATGAMRDKQLGIPGESLPGSHSAAEFVGWYNGHPDFRNRQFDLSGERAVVFGNGNVALDVARVLLRDPEALAQTDIADHALDALRESRIREVIVVGRRGPLEAGFTTPELIGLSEASGLQVSVSRQDIDDADVSATETDRRVLAELLTKLAVEEPPAGRHVSLRFLQSPVELTGDGRVERVILRRNELVYDSGRVAARGTDELEELSCDLVIRAVGYHGTPIPSVPFDPARGTIPNHDGRVVDPRIGEPLPGVYTTGWIKRGPSGVIGTNKSCAHETVQGLLEDWRSGRLACRSDRTPDIANLVPDSIGLEEFRAIDDYEIAAGKKSRRPRVKLVDPDHQLAVARQHNVLTCQSR